jgi:hypothetical protein
MNVKSVEALRASVGSTEAAKDVVARFGRIDRRTQEVSSRLDAHLCTRRPRLVGGDSADLPVSLPQALAHPTWARQSQAAALAAEAETIPPPASETMT